MTSRAELAELLSPCCEVDCYPASRCSDRERDRLSEFLPGFRSVAVVAHHTVCIHCGLCREACPSQAIRQSELLGLVCDQHQDEQIALLNMGNDYINKCELCVRSCPVGPKPRQIGINSVVV